MSLTQNEYGRLTDKATPPTKKVRNLILAFLVGGLICAGGEALGRLFMTAGLDEKFARQLIPITIIFLAAILTGLDVYDDLGKFSGAGTLVPISGFANSMVSAAIEFKSEGFILGVGAKMFQVAGPVIVYGIVSSILYGVVLWIFKLF